jgi:hypothetical protein
MSTKKSGRQEPTILVANDPKDHQGELKAIGASKSDHWNNILANQAVQTLWIAHSDEKTLDSQRRAMVSALVGMGPKDEIEGMIAAQLLAAHNASMANKLSRTYATQLDALNRHRGKGQQKVTVEHVHVHAGGQAVVGMVEHRGVGFNRNQRINPMQSSLPMHLSSRCGARTRSGSACQSPAMPNGRCRMHGGPSTGAPRGNRNAYKHGLYSAEAIARRRSISALIRSARRQCALR